VVKGFPIRPCCSVAFYMEILGLSMACFIRGAGVKG
jgi:hypothetical protein